MNEYISRDQLHYFLQSIKERFALSDEVAQIIENLGSEAMRAQQAENHLMSLIQELTDAISQINSCTCEGDENMEQFAKKSDINRIEGIINGIIDTLNTNKAGAATDSGDVAIVPLDRCAGVYYQVYGNSNGTSYNADDVYGFVFNGPSKHIRGKMFNRIKMMVAVPGLVRIGIVNSNIAKATPKYSQCLVRWLVVDFAAYTGYKEWDFEDTIIDDPDHYLFVESKQGSTGAFNNIGSSAITFGGQSIPVGATTGKNMPNPVPLDSLTADTVFKSQNILTTSARYVYQSIKSSRGGGYKRNWLTRSFDATAGSLDPGYSKGDLNFGVYRRGNGGDYYHNRVIENLTAISVSGGRSDTTRSMFIPPGQEQIVGRSVYASRFECHTPGWITFYLTEGTNMEDFRILRKWSYYIRAIGLQTLRFYEDIILKPGQHIGLNGFHADASSSNINNSADTMKFVYGGVAEMTTNPIDMPFGAQIGFTYASLSNSTFPESVTAINSQNAAYLNICLICRGGRRSKLEDLWVSITGDSISTYRGVVTKTADLPAGNSAGDNAIYYPDSGRGLVNNMDTTWWGILVKECRMRLLRNDAWSGSKVSGTTTNALNSATRVGLLEATNNTIDRTHPYGTPDLILSMIGTNDLSGNTTLGNAIFNSSGFDNTSRATILGAFSEFCYRAASTYPNTNIVHFLIPRGTSWLYINGNSLSLSKLAEEFENIAIYYGQYFIPLSYFNRINPTTAGLYFTLSNLTWHRGININNSAANADGLHPNVQGMEVIADGVKRFLENVVY